MADYDSAKQWVESNVSKYLFHGGVDVSVWKYICQGSTNGKTFELIVKQGEPSLVAPVEETQKGLYFPSNLDQNIAVIVQTIYYFKLRELGNEKAAEVLKESLAKVLVHYYPLAGRLMISQEGKLIVDFSGDGAVFVKAEADSDL